jgi:hypothetical protein
MLSICRYTEKLVKPYTLLQSRGIAANISGGQDAMTAFKQVGGSESSGGLMRGFGPERSQMN